MYKSASHTYCSTHPIVDTAPHTLVHYLCRGCACPKTELHDQLTLPRPPLPTPFHFDNSYSAMVQWQAAAELRAKITAGRKRKDCIRITITKKV